MMGIDINTLNRGVVALERMATALERIARLGDYLDEYQPAPRKPRRPVEDVRDVERFG